MKFTRIFQVLLALSLIAACNPYEIKIPDQNQGNNNKPDKEEPSTPGTGEEEDDTYPVKYPSTSTPKVKTLLTSNFFTETKIKEGITLYSAEKRLAKSLMQNRQSLFYLLCFVLINQQVYFRI